MENRIPPLGYRSRYPAPPARNSAILIMNGKKSRLHPAWWVNGCGFLVCGTFWGVLLGAVLSQVFAFEVRGLRLNQMWIEEFCVWIAIMGTIGLVSGAILDNRIHDEQERIKKLNHYWRLWFVAFLVMGLMCGFWLPAVQ